MFRAVVMALAVSMGYVVTVAIALLATMALAMSFPKFAVADFRIRVPYKWTHESIWLLCAIFGGFSAAAIAGDVYPVLTELALAAVLIGVLWRNSWEAKQRGIAHQIVITIFTAVGLAIGLLIKVKTTPSW